MKSFAFFGTHAEISALARRYVWAAPVVACFAISIGLLEGAGVGLLIPFLATLTDNSAHTSSGFLSFILRFANGYDRHGKLLLITGAIFACLLLKNVLQAAANAFTAWVDGQIGQNIRSSLSERLQGAEYTFFLAQDSSRLMNILGTESWKTSDAVRVVLTRIASVATISVFAILLFAVSWRLSLIVLVGGFAARLLQKRIESKLRVLSTKMVAVNQSLAERMLFAIFGARVIRLFHRQSSEHARFVRESDEVRLALLRLQSLSGALWPTLETVHASLILLVLLVAVFSGVSLPLMIAFLVLMNRLQPHLRTLEQTGTALASAAGNLDEVEWLLASRTSTLASSGTEPFTALHDSIVFDGVTFEYGDRGEPALIDASFRFRRGRSTALIGASGAGKTTVINLLCRLLNPTAGEIRVDGQPLPDLDLNDWLRHIAIAGQDVDLIDGTIAENIAFGLEEVEAPDRAGIEAAARAAQAHFIDHLPRGFDTMVGNRGLNLSGGQRQRIGLARALARKPEILILDEATNAVDQETESAILEALQQLPKTMTLIVISHKPGVVAFCEDAVMFERGRVIKTGALSSLADLPVELETSSLTQAYP